MMMVLLILLVGTGRQALKHYTIQKEIESVQLAISEMNSKNSELGELLVYVQSPAYTEAQARLRFGYAKPGEKLAIIPEGQVLGTFRFDEEGNDQSAETDDEPLTRWWTHFFQ